MTSSDDEAHTPPESVSTYHFVDDKDEPISFSKLPIRWSESKIVDDGKKNYKIFLKGSVDNGLCTIYKQVIAWKFDLSNTVPQISVLTKEKCWMELEKPRKSYEIIIRTALITVHCLHFARRNPEVSGKSLWDYLSKTFSLYEPRPSQNDLVEHMDLIGEAVTIENSLSKCKFLLNFLGEKSRKKMLSDEDVQAATMSAFIVDDVEDDNFEDLEEYESNDEDELFDSVCALCDNGGNLLCCEGSCLRSFHATVKAGEESVCESLGFTNREVEAMKSKIFFCQNCKFKQHQCFACGKLGSSDKFSGAEVFQCANATCGHFYHPHCVSTLIHQEDKVPAEKLQKKIAAGESFACPIHKCCICKQVENKKKNDLQFAVCRRCPTSYHRKCLPKEIVFENEADEDTIARAWEDLLPNRTLIYCLKHDIIEDIDTPIRDHIRFPDVGEKKTAAEVQKRRRTSELPANEEEGLSKKRRLTSEESISVKSLTKASKEMSSAAKRVKVTNESENISSESNSLRNMRTNDASRKSLRENTKSASTEVERSATANVNKSGKAMLRKQDISGSELDKSLGVKSATKKLTSELPSLDADTKRRLLALVKEAASSVTLEEVIKKHEVPSTHARSSTKVIKKHKVPSMHAHSSTNVVEENITLGKVEGTVEAVRTALKKLEEKCSIEDAKAVCEPGVLNQVFKWKNKLKVYLAPFLYGMRYTSFGRHFTKVEKLMEIADILHWYVENGDMIVDFCCGANDFSCLMKKKLQETGKKCSFKNYDVIQPKNDFNFERRDWMTVHPNELPKKGSQLIMGLNPPFGVKAALANKFIDKALQFKPKLLILIVPPETERLDKKKTPYDLVWEVDHFLSGKSFYLPGSVDENDKQMDQWNVTAPLLHLWSCQEWSAKHKAIAQKHGHPFRQQERSNLEKNHFETETPDPVNNQHNNAGASILADDIPMQSKRPEESNCGVVNDDYKGRSPCNNGDREIQESHGPGKSHSNETSRKKRRVEKKVERGTVEKLLEGRQNGGKKRSVSDSYKGMHHPSPPNVDGISSLEGPSRSVERPSHADISKNCYQHLDGSLSGSYTQQHGTPYGGSWAGIHDDMNRRHNTNNHGPYLLEIHGLSSGGNMEEQSTRCKRDGTLGIGYRSYATEMERESDRPSQVRLCGQDADSVQGNHLSSRDLGYGHMGPAVAIPYGHSGLAPEPSYMMNMSAMQRYAPRLDALNHTRVSNLGPEPSLLNRNGSYDPRAPGAGYQFDSMGFAPGPHHPYSHHSAGWLNE